MREVMENAFDRKLIFWDNRGMVSEEIQRQSELGHTERYDPVRTCRLGWVSFLFGFSGAFPLYIASSYFEEASGNANVSLFYLGIFSVVFALLFLLHALLRRFGASSMFLLLILIALLSQAALLLSSTSFFGAGFLMLYFVAVTVAWVNLDIVLENFSEDRRSGRIRSLHLTAMNAGLLLAPFLSTSILDRFGFSGVFLASFVLFGFLLLFSLFALYGINFRHDTWVSPIGIVRKAFHRADVLRIYAISFAMEFFYAAMIVYTPIRLRDLGMEWNDIGIVFTVMLIPFVAVQYPLGILADKKTGEKEFLIGSIVLSALSTAVIACIASGSVVVWAVALFVTRLGIASIEVLRDSYFYKRIDGRDADLIAFFRTSGPLANIVAAIVIGIWLVFLPLASVFLLPALILLLSLVPALFLEDNASERERTPSS